MPTAIDLLTAVSNPEKAAQNAIGAIAAPPYAVHRMGDSGMSAIQEDLKALGYDVDVTDIYDLKTANAVQYFKNNFMPRSNLAETGGWMDQATLEAIQKEKTKRVDPGGYFLRHQAPMVAAAGVGAYLLWRMLKK